MQKSLLHKFFSMTLALLVLLSTFSFKIESHLCGSKIVDVAVFSEVKSCCASTVKSDSKLQFAKKNCCTNKVVSVDGLEQFSLVSFSYENTTEKNFELFSEFNFELITFTASAVNYYPKYSPPNLILDHQIEYQVFLI